MQSDDIIHNSDNRSKVKAIRQRIKARLYKVEGNKIKYTVSSSEGNKQYIVTIQLLKLTNNKLRSLKAALEGDIKISCTCPAFLYQGYKYISYKKQVGIDIENRPPDKTNPDRKGLACKHIIAALDQMKSDYSLIYDKYKAEVPKAKPTRQDYINNKKNQTITELDLELINKFKDWCTLLYKNYIKYTNSSVKDKPFIETQYYIKKNDPTMLLNSLSKPVIKQIKNMFIGKISTLEDMINMINQKKNGFNIMLNSDVSTIVKKLNSSLDVKSESLINNIILTLIES